MISPEILKLQSEYQLAQARLSFERGDPLSEIRLGPVVQLTADGPSRSQLYGFQLSLPLPLWNQNGYGKMAAAQSLRAAEVDLAFEKSKTKEEREKLVKVYNHFRALLSEAPTQSDMRLKHEKIEKLFFQGLVNSALVIEAHRSLIDVQKSRHDTELNVLNSLWKIYRIDGNTSEIAL